MPPEEKRDTKIFGDGADFETIVELAGDPRISGFTTNPTLMRKSGVADYEGFARKVLDAVLEKPVSFEVFSDEFDEMRRQAHLISNWGSNVFVKIPVTNTRGESAAPLIRDLTADGLSLNVTALLSLQQVQIVTEALSGTRAGVVSVFAGRVADTGRDPVPLMTTALEMVSHDTAQELLWASPREVLNLRQAQSVGCHIITMTKDLIAKLSMHDRDLDELSLDTVRMFHNDAKESGFVL
jgi:transaldolase